MRGLLDTSVFIAGVQERSLEAERLPDDAAVSVVTLAELALGVQMAASVDVRARRLAALGAVRGLYVALPIDDDVAEAFAAVVAAARREGRRPKVQDAWIAATARVQRVPVYTQDDDFDAMPGIEVVRV